MLAYIAKNIGLKDLIKTQVETRLDKVGFLIGLFVIYLCIFLKEFPIKDDTLKSALAAVICALSESNVNEKPTILFQVHLPNTFKN
jgi:hypothetical protein